MESNITHSECVSVALVIQYAMRMRQIVVCAPSSSRTFIFIFSQKALFSKKRFLI